MKIRSFRFKLMTVLVILVAVIVAPSILAWVGLERSGHYAERSRTAHDVLDAHLRLAERAQRLLRYVKTEGSDRNSEEYADLRAQLDHQFDLVRHAIANEVAVIGPDGAATEMLELDRLDEIRERLDRALAGADGTRWRRLLMFAVEDEQQEVIAVDAAQIRINEAVRIGLAVATALALAIGAVSLFFLQRSLERPLLRLTTGARALAAGELAYRISMPGDDEFAALGKDFDVMAENIERQAQTIIGARERLEATVRERTSDLAAANARLAEVAARRQRFLADISHELRTPLTIIRGEAEVTLRAPEQPDKGYRASLSRIVEQTNGMARLVDDLLFVARTESGEPRLRMEQVRLLDLVEAAALDVRALIEEDGGAITVNADAGAREAWVRGDQGRLGQLVRILIDNAMRYSRSAPAIEMGIVRALHGWTISVSDHGIGIAPGEIGNVFERYSRGGRAVDHSADGLGLGLPMAKAIVESHGGDIRIASVVDEGTSVTIFLPAPSGLKAVA